MGYKRPISESLDDIDHLHQHQTTLLSPPGRLITTTTNKRLRHSNSNSNSNPAATIITTSLSSPPTSPGTGRTIMKTPIPLSQPQSQYQPQHQPPPPPPPLQQLYATLDSPTTPRRPPRMPRFERTSTTSGGKVVPHLHALSPTDLVALVKDVELRYRKLSAFEAEEIRRAQRLGFALSARHHHHQIYHYSPTTNTHLQTAC